MQYPQAKAPSELAEASDKHASFWEVVLCFAASSAIECEGVVKHCSFGSRNRLTGKKMSASGRIFLLAILAGRAMVLATCLTNGLTAGLRKNLSSSSGESYPVGIVLGSWSSARVTSAVLEILIEEVLGYHLAVDPPEVSSSLEAIYAMLGCATWKDPADRGCDNRTTPLKYHLMSESWYQWFAAYYDLAKMYLGEIPVNGGDMGYKGTSGQYVPRAILDAAENDTGLALEYHKSYNPRWFEPWRYFDNGLGVNTSNFRKCEEIGLYHNATIFRYWKNTGDDGGVTIINNTYGTFCPDGFFWRSPTCRYFPGPCHCFWVGL